LPTSRENWFCTTFGNAKKTIFQQYSTVILIQQIPVIFQTVI